MRPVNTVTVALTGASGLPFGLSLIERLAESGRKVFVLYSQAAQIVARQEMDLAIPSRPADFALWLQQRTGAADGQIEVFGREEWFAPVASGSNPADAMVICPCSMGTLAAIANGMSDNLIERAADVSIKEGRKLVLVPRETPLSVIHLENMLRLARLGAVILPPVPAFYTKPQTLDDMIDFIVSRILDQLGIDNQLVARWGAPAPE
ncbi:flavin prenyltransferase UbiX [Paludibacterium paludis]|uniref:Flavin prenyltransferase UbiX n=1 Tax=Paludibacterium paludis TaxID=1225769 RepID=A0A918U7B8_9NEIS|nr:flavin prenyltransferase UbiX [Paludibacterium paludis]GGY02578.1 flavin prenyltransferase UbiX [Paludibacterium paludis]